MAKGSEKFEIVSKFEPSGDQPRAIEKLVGGLRRGDRIQTLLGATGTGKSVAWDEPVTVLLDDSGRFYRGPIGQLIDAALGGEQTAESLAAVPPGEWRVLAWDPQTGQSAWQPIYAITRHASPETMHRLETSCGREVSVTGDHSVWVLRDGQLQLLPGSAVRINDALPVPRQLPEPTNPQTHLDLLTFFAPENGIYAVVPESVPPNRLLDALVAANDPAPQFKCRRVLRQSEAISLAAARNLLAASVLRPEEVYLRASRTYSAPARLPLSPSLCFLLGQFVAEGHAAERFSLISVREPQMQQAVADALQKVGIPFYRRADGDFVIGTRIWHTLFHRLIGSHAGNKRLPALWVALSSDNLAALIRGYFDGDGGVEKGGVLATTLSPELSADLTEALLRFGILARRRAVWKKKPNGDRGRYWKVTIAGAENLHRFAEKISFTTERKRRALHTLLRKVPQSVANTNVDVVPGVGARLRAERLRRGWRQRDIALRAGCHRAMIGMIECGQRQPSHSLFRRLCAALEMEDRVVLGLADICWTPVKVAEPVPATSEFVYDFSVRDFETFLSGRGGLFVHNTFTAAKIIEQVQRPALVIAHNKTLAAQLCSEFRDFFPHNAVEYFVSYYDYYQPEAYIPQTDTFIEKDSSINEEIDRLRHAATQAVLERRDVIIVASVSCIYGLGSPEQYKSQRVWFHVGQEYDRDDILRRLVNIQFQRNDVALVRGTFRVKGDVLEIQPKDEEVTYRITFDWDTVSRILTVDPLTGEELESRDDLTIFPATHFVSDPDKIESILKGIEEEMRDQVKFFESQNKLLEAQRIEQRTKFDLEMITELGYCSGIENYSRWFDGRPPGTAPNTLLDYFPDDYLIFVDESHQTIPQLHAMYAGDKRRKDTLVEFGFRLPSARDNRPLRFQEFEERIGQLVFISATPGPYEREQSAQIAEQIIRPTGLIDPEILIRPTKGQIDDLISEIQRRTEKGERVLVTTLTKKMSEDLTEYLEEIGTKVQYLHSDVHTLERTEILRDLRIGVYDVLVGINLLREGLDLPEVSLVTILDADKEGFLRSETSLIQTIGRAARNVGGQVILYADRITGSMERAIEETNRRREKQVAYNKEHNITPQTVIKAVRDVLEAKKVAEAKSYYKVSRDKAPESLPLDQLMIAVTDMEKEMKQAAKSLDFETAAQLRDEIGRLKKLLPVGAKR